MAKIKDITIDLTINKLAIDSTIKTLRGLVPIVVPYFNTSDTEREKRDDFTGIMDGPEMMGLEVADSRVMNPDQRAKQIGDLT